MLRKSQVNALMEPYTRMAQNSFHEPVSRLPGSKAACHFRRVLLIHEKKKRFLP
jgi:hypothetical protein